VTFDNGASDVFDTVVVAVGRYADTKGLGLEAVGVKTDPSSGKVSKRVRGMVGCKGVVE
jgi:pyruvate/2-oxoglutarate dehydrogenase complex dihydrolipoamide dehydrogenase (E3) component